MGMFKRLDHVSIGVKDMAKAEKFFEEILGGTPLQDQGHSVKETFSWKTFDLGGKKVEIVSPDKEGEGGVGRYIEKYGEGFHHMNLTVENLDEAIKYFESKGLRVLGRRAKESPKWKVCYLHPKDTFGALIQVVEEYQS